MKPDQNPDELAIQIEKLNEIISMKDRAIKGLKARVKSQAHTLTRIHSESKQGTQSRKIIASWNPGK